MLAFDCSSELLGSLLEFVLVRVCVRRVGTSHQVHGSRTNASLVFDLDVDRINLPLDGARSLDCVRSFGLGGAADSSVHGVVHDSALVHVPVHVEGVRPCSVSLALLLVWIASVIGHNASSDDAEGTGVLALSRLVLELSSWSGCEGHSSTNLPSVLHWTRVECREVGCLLRGGRMLLHLV